MTASPAPISAADREKAKDVKSKRFVDREAEASRIIREAAALIKSRPDIVAENQSLRARVVELEAALAAERENIARGERANKRLIYELGVAEKRAETAEARATALLEALQTAIKVAAEAREEWDKAPSGMKAGKLLIALSDPSLKYRADITAMHAAINAGASNDRK